MKNFTQYVEGRQEQSAAIRRAITHLVYSKELTIEQIATMSIPDLALAVDELGLPTIGTPSRFAAMIKQYANSGGDLGSYPQD